jgi:hypothetical protein
VPTPPSTPSPGPAPTTAPRPPAPSPTPTQGNLMWFDSSRGYLNMFSWAGGKSFCEAKGKRLCNEAEYCPHGRGKPAAGGQKAGDQWAPFGSAGENKWIQVGSWNGRTCERTTVLLASTRHGARLLSLYIIASTSRVAQMLLGTIHARTRMTV